MSKSNEPTEAKRWKAPLRLVLLLTGIFCVYGAGFLLLQPILATTDGPGAFNALCAQIHNSFYAPVLAAAHGTWIGGFLES